MKKKIWSHRKNENIINKISHLERFILLGRNPKRKILHFLKENLVQNRKDYVDYLKEHFK